MNIDNEIDKISLDETRAKEIWLSIKRQLDVGSWTFPDPELLGSNLPIKKCLEMVQNKIKDGYVEDMSNYMYEILCGFVTNFRDNVIKTFDRGFSEMVSVIQDYDNLVQYLKNEVDELKEVEIMVKKQKIEIQQKEEQISDLKVKVEKLNDENKNKKTYSSEVWNNTKVEIDHLMDKVQLLIDECKERIVKFNMQKLDEVEKEIQEVEKQSAVNEVTEMQKQYTKENTVKREKEIKSETKSNDDLESFDTGEEDKEDDEEDKEELQR